VAPFLPNPHIGFVDQFRVVAVLQTETARCAVLNKIAVPILTWGVLAALAPALAQDEDTGAGTRAGFGGACPSAPGPARDAGYCTNTFSTNHNFTTATVDTLYSYQSGFQWYGINHFGFYKGSNNQILLNGDGSASEKATQPGDLGFSTVGSTLSAPRFVGTAFGGGMYVEMTASYDQSRVRKAEGWPALWTFSYEHILNNNSDVWPAPAAPSANYHQWAEFDIAEHFDDGISNRYYATVHHGYGVGNVTCPGQLWCNTQTVTTIPLSTTETPHRYGMLWAPATSTQRGYVKWYLDGVQQGETISWTKQDPKVDAPPPTLEAPWTYGIIDLNHMALIFGGGVNSPITVYDVEVWQVDAHHNLHN
jgi:hypothetical protein